MARVRVHQHVNPLAPFYRQPPEPLDVERIFAEPEKPLLIDIGCARGRFLLRMAEARPDWNYLGIEIRKPLVEEANRIAEEAGLGNLAYVFCNAMLWLSHILESIPKGLLQMATIQFPDPWFKKKHSKRRMVNPMMVATLAENLQTGGQVFIQTDIEFLADEMFGLFRENKEFTELGVTENPFPVKSEREKAVEAKGGEIFRSIFAKV
ncbi:MAG: tRNA (guanosine(46)-N7)-methyltransferase TrmB [Pyrinomonadaceae bacterium]|jgi:tRNA (guanine-N7-)-methyltransferase